MGLSGRVGIAVAVATALLAAGCSSGANGSASGDHGFTIEALASSMTAARTAHVRMTFSYPRDSGSSRTTVPATVKPVVAMTGDFDLTHNIGVLHHDSPASAKTGSIGSEEIFTASNYYLGYDPSAQLPIPPRVAAGKHWIEYPNPLPSRGSAFAVNPYSELKGLRERGVTVRDLGTTHVDGQPVHHYSAVETRPEKLIPGNHTFRVLDDVYVDSHDRLVRLVSASHYDTKGNSDLTIQSDYSNYGAPLHIAVPATADVVEYRDGVTPTPRLQASWAMAASGTGPGYTWKLFRVPADRDRVCWSFETTPAWTLAKDLQSAADVRAATMGSAPPPRHDGHEATCTMTGDWQVPLEAIAVGTVGEHTVVVAVVRDDVVSVRSVDNGAFSLPPGLMPPGPTSHSSPVPIDSRFGGFVDTRSTAQSSYVVRTRNGATQTCPVSFLMFFTVGGAGACDQFDKLPAVAIPPTASKP